MHTSDNLYQSSKKEQWAIHRGDCYLLCVSSFARLSSLKDEDGKKKKITWLRQIKWTLTSFVVSDILWQMHIGDINMQAAARPGGRFRLTSTEYKDEKVCKWVVNRRWTEKTRESEPVSPMLFWMGATIRLLRKTRGRRMNCFLIVASRKSTEGIDRYSIKSKYQIRYSPLSPWSKVVNNTLIFLWSWTCTDLQYIE